MDVSPVPDACGVQESSRVSTKSVARKYSRLERPEDLGRVAQQMLAFKVRNWRRWNGRREILDGEGLALVDPKASPEYSGLQRERLALVVEAARGLSPVCREVAELLLEGRSPGEIVEALGVPAGTAWARISRTRAALGRIMCQGRLSRGAPRAVRSRPGRSRGL